MIKPVLLILASIALCSVDLSSLTLAPSAVLSTLSSASASFFAQADSNVDVVVDAQQCTEPGTCGGDVDAKANNTSDLSADTSSNQEQTEEATPEQTYKPNNSKQTASSQGSSSSSPRPKANPAPRLIFADELSTKIGKGGASPENPIWISILGKIYDVTDGEEFYGDAMEGNYKSYAGRDATPSFSTNNNTPEGAAEDWTEWDDVKLLPILEWARFYQDHEVYRYIGVFGGSQWADERGAATPLWHEFVDRAVPLEKKMNEEKEREKEEKRAARMKKKLDKQKKGKQQEEKVETKKKKKREWK